MRALQRPSARQRGSAYILTLLTLVILTIVGLSLSVVTQTERQLGANEQITQRVFYAANSGTAMATANVLSRNSHDPLTFILNRETRYLTTNVAERVETSRFHPILPSPCNFCEINQGSQFFDVNHAITAQADRVGWTGVGQPPDDARLLGRKTVGQMVAIQPWQVSLQQIIPSLEEDELKKIKF